MRSPRRVGEHREDEGYEGYRMATASSNAHSDLGLKRSVPPPPRIEAVRKSKKRVAYSAAGTGLILC